MFPLGEERRFAFLLQAGGFWNLRESSESTLFADVGGDLSFGRGFVGAGVGLWDFTHSDTTEATIFLNAGLATSLKLGENPVQWFVEGRLFPAMLDMTADNYVVFTGLRVVFKE